jgi:Zn finger protein HypA/HybF involved in hydrogenase expression
MHDFLLAKEIMDTLKKISIEKKLKNIKKVKIEIGSISLSHDGHPEHLEYISIENLKFGLESLAKGALFEKTAFVIKKTAGDNWKIADIEI